MAATVDTAFAEFLSRTVNLDPSDSKGARSSRDWLRDKLSKFEADHDDFPVAYAKHNINFGSFARKTQVRPLDDVDLIHGLHADGAWYSDLGTHLTITTSTGTRLAKFCNANSKLLNSKLVLNRIKKYLDEVPQYLSTNLHRNGQAVRLDLESYDWNFDIVPGFFTQPETDGRSYYIIPHLNGHWMKTDPRIDQDRVTTVNQDHGGKVLDVLRVLKYWNSRPTMPSVPSYAFESLILTYYETHTGTSDNVGIEVYKVLGYVQSAICGSIPDPKGLQGDLNSLGYADRVKVSIRASSDTDKANEAIGRGRAEDHKGAIEKWGEVFGSSFPAFTG